ncbi:MAG TPA: DUF6766 family protein [Lysobacter sp.]
MPTTHEHASFVRRNGLSLAFITLMLLSMAGHALTGWRTDAEERRTHGQSEQTFSTYLGSAHFLSTLFENWESEFLQMGLFVLLTAKLRQKGAAESRPLDEEEETEPAPTPRAQQPWPVRKGGLWLRVYRHSLSSALLLLFAVSMAAHGYNSWHLHAEEQRLHGEPVSTLAEHLSGPEFWFESFQNWQSEFLAVVTLVLLSIVLRERDSTESKPVEAPHAQTGTS